LNASAGYKRINVKQGGRNMATISSLKLGDTANLLYGFKPVWARNDENAKPFYTPLQIAVDTYDVQTLSNTGVWSFPVISVHDDVVSLINKLYDYNVLPPDDEGTVFSIPSGPLTLKDADSAAAMQSLGAYLGIDLTKDDSYMLVRMARDSGKAVHEYVSDFGKQHRDQYLTLNAKAAINAFAASLPKDISTSALTGLNMNLSLKLLNLCYEYGTHFVSTVELGDVFFQVFAINKKSYYDLKAVFNSERGDADVIDGLDSLSYKYYTTAYNVISGHAYGYVTQYGNIISLGNDPVLSLTVSKGEWRDNKYALHDSIFMAYDSSKSGSNFCEQFNSVTVTRFELLPISQLCSDLRVVNLWNRLFKACVLQKYLQGIKVDFRIDAGYKWTKIFPNSSDLWISTIATPTVDIYQEFVDINTITLVNTQQVENFSVFTHVLELGNQQPKKIPGKNVIIMSYMIDATTSSGIPVLEFSGEAYESHELVCGNMLGAAVVRNADGVEYYTLIDAFLYYTGETDVLTGRFTVGIKADMRIKPTLDILQSESTNIGFSLVSAQSALASRGTNAEEIRKFEKQYLDWLASIIPVECGDSMLLNHRNRAIYLSKISGNLRTEGTPVPYLTYNTYKDYVNSMIVVADELSDKLRDYQRDISVRKLAELTIQTSQQLNENIKSTGSLLTRYFGDLAQNQADMSTHYNMIVAQKQQEFDATITDINNLNNLMLEQQRTVDETVSAFQLAIVEWESEEIMKFCLDIAQNVFTLGVALFIPLTETESVKKLAEMATKIKDVIETVNSLTKLSGEIADDVSALNEISDALSNLNNDLDMPTAREWEEFSIHLEASLANVPNDSGPQKAKADLIAAFKILVLRAQSWIDANAKLGSLKTEIYYNQQLVKVNAQQAERMDSLSKSLHLGDISDPEINSIDLVGLSGQIQFQLKQVMAMLADTLMLQDSAVQFEYLGAPVPISRFDLVSVKQVMSLQQQNIINALTMMNPTPKPVSEPIVYRIKKVPVNELIRGNVFEFIIQPSSTEFHKYSMVRIDKVIANILGIKGSNSGEYLINLTYKGNPFEDRDRKGNVITFNTNERYFGPYDYRILDGKAIFGDKTGSIDKKITKITPFSTWQISLPDSSTNTGLEFNDETVDIELSFSITALLIDHKEMLIMEAANDSNASLDKLLDQMYQNQAVLKGWDVVFNMMEEPVNRFLKAQYDDRTSVNPMIIDVSYCEKIDNPDPDPQPPSTPYIASYTRFSVNLDTPIMQFETNNSDYVTVKQLITSGHTQKGSKFVDEAFDPNDYDINDLGIRWGKEQAIDVSNSPYIQGTVALGNVDGLVQDAKGGKNTKSVILDFTKGSFTAQKLNISVNNTKLREELTTYFMESDITYLVNTLDLNNLTTYRLSDAKKLQTECNDYQQQ
jgi:hypothetical protein